MGIGGSGVGLFLEVQHITGSPFGEQCSKSARVLLGLRLTKEAARACQTNKQEIQPLM